MRNYLEFAVLQMEAITQSDAEIAVLSGVWVFCLVHPGQSEIVAGIERHSDITSVHHGP